MECVLIEEKLREFIDKTVLRGQGADLTSTTPLFELGILDSFHLFGVLNFIEQQFDVRLALESLTSADFRDISTIARIVLSKTAAAPAEA